MTESDKTCSAGKQKNCSKESILIKDPKDYSDFKERDACNEPKINCESSGGHSPFRFFHWPTMLCPKAQTRTQPHRAHRGMLLFETPEGKTCLVLSGDCSRIIYTALWRLRIGYLLCQRSRFLPAYSYTPAFLWHWLHLYLKRDTVDPCCLIRVSSPSRDERDCTHLVEMRSWKHCQFSKLFFFVCLFWRSSYKLSSRSSQLA